jgi:restriction system protein
MLDVVSRLSRKFSLSKRELEKRIPSGTKPLFYDRVHWAVLYLKHAGLIKSTRVGNFQITTRGINALNSASNKINKEYLKQYPEFVEFIKYKKKYNVRKKKA